MTDLLVMDNPEYVRAMQELRRSSATSRHKDRRADSRKGWGKGGRRAWKIKVRNPDRD